MRGKSSSPEPAELLWHRTRLSWPVECFPALIEVVHPRRLSVLEWAVLRAVDAFGDAPPPLKEVAEELGIGDVSFLQEALRDVVRLRALESRVVGTTASDLPELRFTETGRELFRRGQIEGEPAQHGVDLYFDALTDEARAQPRGLQDRVEKPFPAAATSLEARPSVGLERARSIIRQFHADLVRGDGEVRSVQARPDASARVGWAPVEIELRLSEDGQIIPGGSALTPAARRYLGELDLLAEGIAPRAAATSDWADPDLPRSTSSLTLDAWRRLTSGTLATGETKRELLRLIGTAQRETLLHAGWYADSEVNSRLNDLAGKGVTVVVLGAEATEVSAFHDHPKPGLLVTCNTPGALLAAVIVDGQAGLLANDVVLRYGEQRLTVELAGNLSPCGCDEVRARYLKAATAALALPGRQRAPEPPVLRAVRDPEAAAARVLQDPALRVALARLALVGDARDVPACTRLASLLAPGPERVRVLGRLGNFSRAIVQGLPEADARAPAMQAWRSLVDQLRAGITEPGLVEQLAALAPPGTEAVELIGATVDALMPRVEGSLNAAAELLLTLHRGVEARWGRGVCRANEAYRKCRERLLQPGKTRGRELAAALAAARRLLDARELNEWLASALGSLPTPTDPKGLESWMEQAGPLLDLSREHVSREAAAHFGRLLRAQPAAVVLLLRAARRIVEVPVLLRSLLPATPTLQDISQARRLLIEAEIRGDNDYWCALLERALPPPSPQPSPEVVTNTVRTLADLGNEEAAFRPVGRNWAKRVAAAVPAPDSPGNLATWLATLGRLRPILDDLRVLASERVRALGGPLLASRDRGEPMWGELKRVWAELGLPIDLLDRTVAEAARPTKVAPASPSRERLGKGRP